MYTFPLVIVLILLKVVVNKSEIEFGPICIGETIKRSVTVHNDGALPTDFTFLPLNETVSSYTIPIFSMHSNNTKIVLPLYCCYIFVRIFNRTFIFYILSAKDIP